MRFSRCDGSAIAILLIGIAITACSDRSAPMAAEEDDVVAVVPRLSNEHWACHLVEPSSTPGVDVFCQDRHPLDWERDFLNDYTSGLCAEAQAILNPVINGGEARIRIDPQAAGADWHFEGGLHVKDDFFNRAPWDVMFVLAHEAGHHACQCQDQELATQFAYECIGYPPYGG